MNWDSGLLAVPELEAVLQAFFEASNGNVVGMDIVEVMPIPGSMQTEFLAAKLAYKVISHTQPSS